MKTEQPLMLYLRSTLNIGLLTAAAVAAVVGALFLGPLGRMLVPLGAVAGYLAITVAMLRSQSGAKAIVKEGDEDRTKAALAAIRATGIERDRIAVLRIADPRVRKAVEYFLQISGEYLEACRRLATYSPEGSEKVREVLSLLQIHLERLDGASTEEEYGLKDQGAVKSSREEATEETVAGIHAAASFVKERMASELSVLAAQDKLQIMEEMEGKQ
jgi:hypothetical protein